MIGLAIDLSWKKNRQTPSDCQLAPGSWQTKAQVLLQPRYSETRRYTHFYTAIVKKIIIE